jgi:hypothetical protein
MHGEATEVDVTPVEQGVVTGVEQVDRLLLEVAALADRPVHEHVAVYEQAHEQLRRALDARASD